jgi:HAD superfamily hydrolase (TIGR01509 family)
MVPETTGLTPASPVENYESEFGRRIPYSLLELMQLYSWAFQANLSQLQEVRSIADVARRLKFDVPMAVASNGERDNVIASLRATGLLELFDVVVTAEDVKRGKPAPDLFLEAAHRLCASPRRCLVFEDSDEGLMAAKAARMKSVDVRKSRNIEEALTTGPASGCNRLSCRKWEAAKIRAA